MPVKKPRQPSRGAKGRQLSSALMGSLELSAGDPGEKVEATERPLVTPRPPKNGLQPTSKNPMLSGNEEVLGDSWETSPQRSPKEDIVAPVEEQATLGMDWPDTLGNELDNMESDAPVPEQPVQKSSSSPHTFLERSLRGIVQAQSTQQSAQSQRTVALIGDDFGHSDDAVDDEELPDVQQLLHARKLNQRPKKGTVANSSLQNTSPNQDGAVMDVVDNVPSPKQAKKSRPLHSKHVATSLAAQQSQIRKTKQLAKQPFNATRSAVPDPRSQVQPPPPKVTDNAGASRARPPGQNESSTGRKAKTSEDDGVDTDMYDIGSDVEDRPKVLGGQKSRKAPQDQSSVRPKAVVPKKTAPKTSKSKPKPPAAPAKGRKAAAKIPKKRGLDEDFTPVKESKESPVAPQKRVKRHQMMETSQQKTDSSPVKPALPKVSAKASKPSLRGNNTQIRNVSPVPDADQSLGHMPLIDDTPIIIPSDSPSDSDYEERSMSSPTKQRPSGKAKDVGKVDRTNQNIPEKVRENIVDPSTLVHEHAFRKPQVISFSPAGPLNLGRRLPRKHEETPTSKEPRKKAKLGLQGKSTTISAAPKPPLETAISVREAVEHAALCGDYPLMGETIPLSDDMSSEMNETPSLEGETDKVRPATQNVPEETPMVAAGENRQDCTLQAAACQPEALKSAPKPITYNFRAPSRRSSRVDETGSPNATRVEFAMNGAPAGNLSGFEQDMPMVDITEKPPPGFSLQDLAADRPTALPVPGPAAKRKSEERWVPKLKRNALPALKYKDSSASLPTNITSNHFPRLVEQLRRPAATKFSNNFNKVLQMEDQSKDAQRGVLKPFSRTPVSISEESRPRYLPEDNASSSTLQSNGELQSQQHYVQDKTGRLVDIREGTLGTVVPKIVELLLEKLKAKDASVENVAHIYARNGAQLVDEVEALHTEDRRNLTIQYEERRNGYISNCEATRKQVKHLREAMKKASISPQDGSSPRDLAGRRFAAVQQAKAKLGVAKTSGGLVV